MSSYGMNHAPLAVVVMLALSILMVAHIVSPAGLGARAPMNPHPHLIKEVE